MQLLSVGAAAMLSLVLVGTAQASTINFTASLSGSDAMPPTASKGAGSVRASLDTDSKMFTYHATYAGLSGPATAIHFHGPAMAGEGGPVEIPIMKLTSPIEGMQSLTDEQAADLMAGKWSFNVHTAKFPGGEIGGLLKKAN